MDIQSNENTQNTQVNQEVSEKTVNVKSLKKDLDRLTDIVSVLAETVDNFVKQPRVKEEFVAPDAKPSEYIPKGYVPSKYRQIVDEVLSSEFGLDCGERADSMDFSVTIVVPTRYSSLTAQEKADGVLDLRSKVISRAVGENGVREWALKVRENLNKFYASSGVVSPFVKA